MSRVVARFLNITVDSTDRGTELTSHEFKLGDRQTFSDFTASAPTAWEFEAVQDHEEDSLWDLAVNQPGTSVTFLYKPYGNATASATQPHFSGTMQTAGPSDTFAGGKASESTTEGLVFSASWRVTSWLKVVA